MIENTVDICATLSTQVSFLTLAGTVLSEVSHRYFGIGPTHTDKTMKIIASRGQEIRLNVGSEQR